RSGLSEGSLPLSAGSLPLRCGDVGGPDGCTGGAALRDGDAARARAYCTRATCDRQRPHAHGCRSCDATAGGGATARYTSAPAALGAPGIGVLRSTAGLDAKPDPHESARGTPTTPALHRARPSTTVLSASRHCAPDVATAFAARAGGRQHQPGRDYD